jgi:hypothetical protein
MTKKIKYGAYTCNSGFWQENRTSQISLKKELLVCEAIRAIHKIRGERCQLLLFAEV